MSVVISDEIIQASCLSPHEFCQEIAISLFQDGHLSLSYASQLANLSANDFRQLLQKRQIPLYTYDLEDFELDIKNLQELGRL